MIRLGRSGEVKHYEAEDRYRCHGRRRWWFLTLALASMVFIANYGVMINDAAHIGDQLGTDAAHKEAAARGLRRDHVMVAFSLIALALATFGTIFSILSARSNKRQIGSPD